MNIRFITFRRVGKRLNKSLKTEDIKKRIAVKVNIATNGQDFWMGNIT